MGHCDGEALLAGPQRARATRSSRAAQLQVASGALGPVLLPNITTAAGGVPIRSGERVIGAVGISGTPGSAGGGEHDAKCAEAAIQKLKL